MKERIRAMHGEIDAALQSLGDAIQLVETDHARDALGLGLVRAELLHLDLRHNEALAAMEEVVKPHMCALTDEERFGVEQNWTDIQICLPSADTRQFYNIVDQKQLLNFDWLNYHDLFLATQDVESGKHFEALPVLWQQLRRVYLHGCWLANRWTNKLFARECVHLEQWEDAIHHAILAQDETLLDDIAQGILGARSSDLVDRVVDRLLNTANLRAHFVVGCKLLRALEDAIPDVRIPTVGRWLVKRAQELRQGVMGVNPVSEAWHTIADVAPRFPPDLAQSTIAVAIAHPAWTTKLDDPNRVIIERQDIVRALVPLACNVSPDDISPLASATLPLLTERRQFSDYDDVVNLLCHLSDRGGPNVRDLLATSLYPPGQPITRVLVQVADIFGRGEAFESAPLQSLAGQVAQEIRRQVQWLNKDQIADPVAEQFMEHSSTKADRTLKVFVVGLTGLHALARHRSKLAESSIAKILDAILDLARNKDNFCVNRAALLHALIGFADVLSLSMIKKAERELAPVARGAIEESSEYPTAADADDPLNAFKFRLGTPDDVQGMALIALAALAAQSAAAAKRVGDILEDTLCDPRPAIRRASYAAARRLRDVSEGVVLGVLAGLRDPDPNAAVSAFAALGTQAGWRLNRNHWRVFLMAARLAQRTGGPNLRKHAAIALVAWSSKCPIQLTGQHTKLLTEFRNDICWSVRTSANPQSATSINAAM